jgi:hypothetical protein
MKHHHLKHSTAALICCVDYRFWDSIISHLKKQYNVHDLDLETLAGAAKQIAEGNEEAEHVLFHEIEISQKLRDVSTVFLVSHEDCSAYGGSKKFRSKLDEERLLFTDLLRAKKKIEDQFDHLGVVTLFAYMDDDEVKLKEVNKEVLDALHYKEEDLD